MDKKTTPSTPAASSNPTPSTPTQSSAGTTDPSNDVVKALLKLLRDADRQVATSLELSDEAQAAVDAYRRIAADLATRGELSQAQLIGNRRATSQPNARVVEDGHRPPHG